MYIKIGRTAIRYITPEPDDFMIIAGVPTSSISPEEPTLIRDSQELRLFFGEEFPEYSYFTELLEQGNTLYLMGPSETAENQNLENYIDILGIAEDFYITQNSSQTTLNGYTLKMLPERALKGLIFRVIDEEGSKIGGPVGRYNEYVFIDEGWIDVRDLPQNTWINTNSQNNRDTLRLCDRNSKIKFCHPPYLEDIPQSTPFISKYYKWTGDTWEECNETSENYSFTSLEELNKSIKKPKDNSIAKISIPVDLSIISPDKINSEDETLAFIIEGGFSPWTPGDFVVFDNVLYGKAPSELLRSYTPKEIVDVSSTSEFFEELKLHGWSTSDGTTIYPEKLYSKVTYFYNHKSLDIKPSWELSQKFLTSWTIPSVEFYSKTLGSEGPDSWITIKTEDLEEEGIQRVTISRFDYVEVFEGTWLKGNSEEERLDHKISKNSKIVSAKYYGGIPSEGDWILRGAKELKSLNKDRTAEFIFASEIPIDFFLSYGDISQELLLGLAKTKGCQVLIENKGEDYKNNIIDKTNHLLYFYGPLMLGGVIERPAWYLWLQGLLSDVYSATTDYMGYDSPADGFDEDTSLCKALTKARSNYLLNSGQELFYKTYSWSGETETAFTRFVLNKISRELQKHKWEYIGSKPDGRTMRNIKSVIDRVKSSFGIIRSIEITDYNILYTKNKIELTLETNISDLPDKNISLDITLNYNK